MRLYGSIQNRFEENKMYCNEIKVGTGMTEYLWSDRHPYEVIKVKDQKHITVRALDHKPVGGPYSNEWELVSNEENIEREMANRNGKWYFVRNWSEYGKNHKQYIRANVSFGVAEYYYDYEF